MTVFNRIGRFGFVHHRALNSPSKLQEALSIAAEYSDYTHVMEGDICWSIAEGECLFYFRHPDFIFDTLPHAVVSEQLARREILDLDALKAPVGDNVLFVVELKVGRGSWRDAVATMLETLDENCRGRYWVDGFSLRMLRHVKALRPETPVTLHTERVFGETLLMGAPEFPPFKLKRLDALTDIDGISVRRRGGEATMRRACASVLSHGKVLTLSRLHNLDHLRLALECGAVAGYMHGDFAETARCYERIVNEQRAGADAPSNPG